MNGTYFGMKSGLYLMALIALAIGSPARGETLVLSIDQAVERAVQNSPDILAAHSEHLSSQAKTLMTRKEFYPVLRADAGGTYNGVLPQTFINGESLPSSQTTDFFVVGKLQQTLYAGGRIRAAERQAEAVEKSSLHTVKQTENTVRAKARDACLEVLRATAALESSEEALKAAREHDANAQARFRAGMVPTVEVVRAGANVKQAELDELDKKSKMRLAVASLAILLGLPEEAAISLSDRLPTFDSLGAGGGAAAPASPGPGTSEGVDLALKSRPDLLSLRAAAEADLQAVDVAYSHYLPELSVFASATHEYSNSWALGVNFGWEIFALGKTRNEVEAARMHADASEQTARVRELQARTEIQQASLITESARESIRLAEARVKLAREELDLTFGRFKKGVTNGFEVIDAQSKLSIANAALIQAQTDYVGGKNKLWLATGGEN